MSGQVRKSWWQHYLPHLHVSPAPGASQSFTVSLKLWVEVAEGTEVARGDGVACQEHRVELHLAMLWE